MAFPGSIGRRLDCHVSPTYNFSVKRGFRGGDNGGPLSSSALTRFPQVLVSLHATLSCSLCAGNRRIRTAITQVVPSANVLMADLT
jgi:hypothetical protein